MKKFYYLDSLLRKTKQSIMTTNEQLFILLITVLFSFKFNTRTQAQIHEKSRQIEAPQFSTDHPSIHQEQSEYYESLGNQPVSFYDSLMEYRYQPVQNIDRNCTLDKIVFGWHPYWVGSSYTNYDWSLLSDFSFFSYQVDANTGNPTTTHGWATSPAVDMALANGVRVNLCVTLFSNLSTFLSNATSRQTLITNLINLVQSRGAHGVNIDFEGIPSSQRNNFTTFMTELSTQMHAAIPGSQVSTVLYSVDWNNVFDIPALVPHVDLFVIMGYGYYYSGSSTAGPNDPLYPFSATSYQVSLSKTIGYYLKEGMPKEKLVMGLPYYGREWKTQTNTVPSATISSVGSKTYSQIRNNSNGYYNNEQWHAESSTPYYIFNDGTDWRQTFALSARSLAERLDNIRLYDIGGMGIWALAYDNGYPDFWNVLRDKMTNCYAQPCNDTIFDMGGAFRNYYNREDYTITINPQAGQYPLSVNFLNFDLENNYDYLYLYDGPDTTSSFLGRYSGNTSPGSFTANTGALTLRFDSDGATVRPGWFFDYACQVPGDILPDTIVMGEQTDVTLNCGLNYHLLYDSGGKDSSYSNNENLVQTLCNSDSTKSVRISFRPNPTADIQIKMSSSSTGNDYIYLYNGDDETDNLIGTYTGTTSAAPQPGTYISNGPCLTIKTKSDATDVSSGFEARVYCTDRPQVLSTQFVGGVSGNKTFVDQGGAGANYGNNESYVQTFCPDPGSTTNEVVWVEFQDTIGIEGNWDYLYVFDGDDPLTDRILNVYTGDTNNVNLIGSIGATVSNTSGCLSFAFFSDGAETHSGWEATVFLAPARERFGMDECNSATLLEKENVVYGGTTALATGDPGVTDPALTISLASLPECSGSNTITRLENTVWYTFTTVDTFCFADQVAIKLNNISCQDEIGEGSGLQFVLYEVTSCQNGQSWGSPIYCADKLLNGDSVVINNLLTENTTYYLMLDGFSGQNCNFDLQLENKDTTGCLLLSEEVVHVNYKQLRIYPNPTAQFLNIHMEGIGSQRTEIDIFDVSGRKVSQETSQKDDSTVYIDVSHLKAGIYVVKVKMGELYYFEKFQKL